MARAETIKLRTNIPLIGTVSAIYFQPSKREGWSDQICLYGDWDAGKGKVYLSDWCAEVLQGLGVITGGPNDDGRYDVKPAELHILRTEDGAKKQTDITLADGEAERPVATERPTGGKDTERPPATVATPNGREQWKALQGKYVAARDIAVAVLPKDTPPEVIQAATATLFIEANKQGLSAP